MFSFIIDLGTSMRGQSGRSRVDVIMHIKNASTDMPTLPPMAPPSPPPQASRGKGLPEDAVWRYLIQCLLGLNHIHGKKIIHRDIKALNLFLDAGDNIKV